jgi:hypothetical protein
MIRCEIDEAEYLNVLALAKPDGQQYVFIFDDAQRCLIMRQFAQFAADPELSFTWYDAAILTQRVRQMAPTPIVADAGVMERFERSRRRQ